MGYTHYFSFNKEIERFSENVLVDIKNVIQKYNNILSINTISATTIFLNGVDGEDYEDFVLCNNTIEGEFCKTAEKPYDLPVCEILLIFKHHYKDNFNLDSDGFWVSKDDFKKKKLDGYWAEALANIKKEFGYNFNLIGKITGSNGYQYYKFDIAG